MSGKRKRLIWIIFLVIGILIVIALYSNKDGDTFKVITAKAEMRTLVETVVANGKIQPETEVTISSEVSGKIMELPFKEGAKVQKGDLLVKINPDLAQAALDRAQAALNNARANKANADARLLQAEAQFKNNSTIFTRNKGLLDQGAISTSEYDNIQATFETSQAEVMAARESAKASGYTIQSAMASVKEASDSYNRTTIYAPMSGTISRLNVEIGEQVVGAMQMTGTEIMRVANLEVMEVLADINESDIVRVAFGDTAEVEVDAYLARTFTGVVTEIANSAKSEGLTSDQVTNFEVKIRILTTSYADLIKSKNDSLSPFRPGMNATVDIRTEVKPNILTVPIESVTSRSDTTSRIKKSNVERLMGQQDAEDTDAVTCVFTLEDGLVRIAAVTTGIQDDKFIEITSGLEPDAVIVSGPYDVVSQKLMPGDKVEVTTKENLYSKD